MFKAVPNVIVDGGGLLQCRIYDSNRIPNRKYEYNL